MKLRSHEWLRGRDELGFQHRGALRMLGLDMDRYRGEPVVGIASSWSELNPCDLGLRMVVSDDETIRPLDRPVAPSPTLAVLRGNLAPAGAVLKVAAATPALLQHEGPALVFDSHADMLAGVDDPDLDVSGQTVLVLRHAGPRGAPGMPEWGMLPIPKTLQQAGVSDMVRLSDARMSGTGYGTVVLHVAPEAAAGGPLALVRTGDRIALDTAARRVDLLVPDAELAKRRDQWEPPETPDRRGWPRLYRDTVLQADEGCDLEFLRPRDPAARRFVPPEVGRS